MMPAAATRGRLRLGQLEWTHIAGVGGLHLALLAAPFTFSWSGLALALFLWWVCGGLGTCLGYHRLFCHKSFKTRRWIEIALALFGSLSWQGSPILWVGKHRLHHRHAEGEDDPHTPRHGFAWAHMLWVFARADDECERAAARDLQNDPVMRWLDQWHFITPVLLAPILYAVGELGFGEGASWLVWGLPVRMVFAFHATWCVNSVTHRFGYRNYPTDDDSRNNWWVSLLTFGEGWHNNHHAAQRAAAHGRLWHEIDVTYLTIRALALAGLAWDIVPARPPDRS